MQAAFRRRHAWLALCAALAAGGCARPPAESPAQDTAAAAIAAANEQLAQGRTTAAIAALETLRATQPQHAAVLEALAFAYVQDGQGAKAAPLFEQAAVRESARRPLLVYAAGIHAQEQRHADAARVYRAYLNFFPEDTAAWRNVAREHAALNQPQPALEAYGKVLGLAPDAPLAAADCATIALLYARLGDADRAAAWWRTALDASPDAATAVTARLALLEFARQRQDWDDIEQQLAALEADPAARAALAASPLAALPAQARDRRAALAAAAEARRLEEAAQQWQLRLARIGEVRRASVFHTRRPAHALIKVLAVQPQGMADYSRSGADDARLARLPVIIAAVFTPGALPVETPAPKNSPSGQFLAAARMAEEAGDWGAACGAYWKALGEDDSSAAVWLALGRASLSAGRAGDAANIAQEAARRAPDDPAPALLLLETLRAAPSPARYRAELVAAQEKFPGTADIAFAAAGLFRAQNNPRAEALIYREFLRRAPADDPRRADAEAALATLPDS